MTYEELQKCELPLEVNWLNGPAVITSYNRAGLLVTEHEEDFIVDIEYLQDFSLKPKITTLRLYKYNYYDKARQESLTSSWTTLGNFYDYFPNNNNFELRSTEIKTVEVEE